MKVTTQTLPSYKIPRKEEDKTSKTQPKKSQKNQDKFHNQAFAELKKLNQTIALIQKTQSSLHQIQKELKDIQHNNTQSPPSKLSYIQAKLAPILEHAKKNHLLDLKLSSNFSDSNLKDLQEKISIEQSKLAHKLNETTQKIQSFFTSSKEFDFQKEMLKDPRFKEAHNVALFSSSAQTLAL